MLYNNNALAPVAVPLSLSDNAKDVLCTLIYYDIFHYPLSAQEIFERSTLVSFNQVGEALEELLILGAVVYIKGFFCLHKNEALVERRLEGNALAQKSMKTAKRVSNIIRRFPFVRGIMLSGSISKNYMDKDSDIDYFIVTAPNRLWVSRLFFVLLQKLVFLNKYKYCCYNYMVDENHISIGDKSFYTAIEASSLLPVYGYETYRQLRKHNLWMQAYFPNYPVAEEALLRSKQSKVQRLMEALLNNGLGEWLDKWLMQKTETKWRKTHSPNKFGQQGLQLQRHTAKAHTEGHYNRIMALYDKTKKEYEQRYNIKFAQKPHLIAPIKLNA